MATTTTNRLNEDPLRSFRFQINFNDAGAYKFTANAGFMNVTGLSETTEIIPYREGGMNTTTRKMPGQTDYTPVSMSKGVIVGELAVLNWMNQLFDVVQGSQSTQQTDFRIDVDIYLLAHPWPGPNPPKMAGWRLHNAWPTSVAFSDLDAGANSISISQMTLAHEGWEFKLAPSYSGSVSF
jgi:phage tail-like protein